MERIERKLDLGRSHLRVTDGAYRYLVDDSAFKEISDEIKTRLDISDPYNDFKIVAAPIEGIVGRRFVKGKAMGFYKAVKDQADNQHLKVEQEQSYINLAYLIAREIIDAGVESENTVDVSIAVCIPTSEHYTEHGDELKDKVNGKFMVQFPVSGKIVTFNISKTNVIVAPEGPIAMMPTIVEGEQGDLIESTTGVIVDCGEGSCDITLVIEGEAQGQTARSFPFGGISLKSAVSSALERKGLSSSDQSVDLAIKHGYTMVGADKHPVGPMVAECKERLAQMIKKSIVKVVNEEMIQASDISYFFPVGRNFKLTTESKDDPCYTGDLAEMLLKIWDTKIEKIDIFNDIEGHKCIDRTASIKNGKYPEVDIDILDVANVYGLGYALSDNDVDEEEDNE